MNVCAKAPKDRAAASLVEAILSGDPNRLGEVPQALADLGLQASTVKELATDIACTQGEVQRLRRREHGLEELFSSARELAAERDGDVLLEKIVERAHQMVGSDLTYLSEYDPDSRELFVRKTIGSVSSDFRALRVPPGKGLASVVVEQRSGKSVLQYNEIESARHEIGIDTAVNAEGIVSMLGVPMLAEEDVLGVLFVSTREEHRFTPEDAALLTALASHASVVLQNARTLRSLQHAKDESRSALSRLTEHLVARDRANNVHRKLVDAVLTGGDFEAVASTLSEELGRPVRLQDKAGNSLADAGNELAELTGLSGQESLQAAKRSAASGRFIARVGDGHIGGVSAFAAGDRYLGTIIIGRRDLDLSDIDARTIERAAQVCALLVLSHEAVAEAEYRVHSELVADLLSPDAARRRDAVARGRQRGIEIKGFTSLLAFSVPAGQRSQAADIVSTMAPTPSLVGDHQGLVVALAQPGLEDRAEHLRRAIGRQLNARPLAVVAPPGEPSAQFPMVKRTVRLLESLKISDVAVETYDFLPYAAVFDADSSAMEHFLGRTLDVVKRYDTDRGTELLKTLRAFVHCGASPTQTARALNYHVNTILQRLDRLDRILGAGWRQDERFFRISLAVRIDELRDRLVIGSST